MKLPVIIFLSFAAIMGWVLHTINIHIYNWEYWAIVLMANTNYYLGSLVRAKTTGITNEAK